MTRLEVLYQAEQDLESWMSRSARGEVPGRWPYGLHELAEWNAEVTASGLPAPSTASRLLARVLPPGLRAPGLSLRTNIDNARDIGLTWDENAARRMLIGKPHREMYTGVIWLTDMVKADPASCAGLVRTLRQMKRVWVINRPQLGPLREILGADGPPAAFIRFGIDASFFQPSGYPADATVLSIGSDRHRDTETLFAALHLVHLRRPDARILVQTRSELIPPPGVTKIEAVAHHELRTLYARSSVVAVATKPNLHASGMTVALEALASARPVVISHTPGMEDYVAHGVTGTLCGTGQPEAMSEAILALLEDQEGARRMGERGRQAVEATFTTSHMVQELARLLELPDGGPPGRADQSFRTSR